MLIRAKFTKEEPVRFISHLDVVRVFDRAVRRASLPIAFSGGFNPRPQMGFTFPLPVGVTSSSEYVDIKLTEYISPEVFKKKLNDNLPKGFYILEAREVEDDIKPLMSVINTAVYDVVIKTGVKYDERTLHFIFDNFLNMDNIIIKKEKKKRGKKYSKNVNIRPFIYSLKILSREYDKFILEMKLHAARVSVGQVIQALKQWDDKLNNWEMEKVHRKGLFIKKNSELFSPFD